MYEFGWVNLEMDAWVNHEMDAWVNLKATSGGLNADFYTESWPLLVALTICAEPSQPYEPALW